LPPSNDKFLIKVNEAYQHYINFTKHHKLENIKNMYYEFGAGWNLVVPISMTYLGFEVHCLDIRRLIIPELIRDSLHKFALNKDVIPFQLNRIEKVVPGSSDIIQFLKREHGLYYHAPADARNTSFEDRSIDFISSTATLEHIPKEDILHILMESYRILSPGGIMSISIDYKDHWSYFDKNISIYNFLRYSDQEWQKYNPSLHYQNRLRHSDYMTLIAQTSFEVVGESPIIPNDHDLEVIETIALAEKFQSYDPRELAIRGSEIILLKPV
jgi:SAM-dependent methyltransferase